MRTVKNGCLLVLIAISVMACKKETREKLKKAKQGISNTATIVKNAQDVQKDIEKLKEATPLTNDQLKSWLPETIEEMKRTGFKAGQAMYANVASIEGTYDTPDEPSTITNDEGERVVNPKKKTFRIQVMDGAGPTGSMMIASLNMLSKLDMEEESQYQHKKTVTVDGIRALQTLRKPTSKTSAPWAELQFVYKDRLGVIVKSSNMNMEETWRLTKSLELESLLKEAS